MPLFVTREVVEITGGRLVAGLMTTAFRRVWTDSRTVRRGDLFVALSGERFDGHAYVEEALKKGAVGALVRPGYYRHQNVGAAVVVEVADPLRGYQDLAAAHRRRFAVPVVAVSGSNGKTTTKEMVGCVLSERFNTLVTVGNLNNHIGVPQTLLRMTGKHEAAVIEMGISHVGEMTRLCEIAAPTHGLLTNIGPTHLETLLNVETVAQAKGEMLETLPATGTAILNADDPFFKTLSRRASGRVLSFGFAATADVRGIHSTSKGPASTTLHVRVHRRARVFSVKLRVSGRHNLSNALAAVGTGIALGVSVRAISKGLAGYRPRAMRSEVRRWRGVTVLKDCYNANPASLRAALQWLTDSRGAGRAFAVLGDMLELGEGAARVHRDIGGELARQGIEYVLTTGPLAAEIARGAREGGMTADHAMEAVDHEALAGRLRQLLQPGDIVLVKGSRGARMERVVEAL